MLQSTMELTTHVLVPLVLQMVVQLVGEIRFSFQVQRTEQLVVVPLFSFQVGSQRFFAVPKFSREDRIFCILQWCGTHMFSCRQCCKCQNNRPLGIGRPPVLEDFLGTVFDQPC